MKGTLLAATALAALAHALPTSSSSPSSLVLVPSTASPSLAPACATYLGIASSCHVFTLPPDCETALPVVATFDEHDGALFWVQDSALDQSVAELREREAELNTMAKRPAGHQITFSAHSLAVRVLATLPGPRGHQLIQSPYAALSLLSPFSELVALTPSTVLSSSSSSSSDSLYPPPLPVPARDVARIAKHLQELQFVPLVSTLLSALAVDGFKKDVTYLTGEDQSAATSDGERWISRHSMSEGGAKASDWLHGQLSATGLNCTQLHYLPGFSPLVSCEVVSSARAANASTVVLGAHFDSRGSFGYPGAPGGDDDASGTSLLLSVARLITNHKLNFDKKIRIVGFSGEEQGLLGSNWFAKELKHKGEDVELMIQVDMIGYRKPGEPLQLAFPPDTLGLQEARYLMGNISSIYVPELQVGITPACCSDHQSFSAVGYAASWVFERNGPIADPMYHNSGDLSNRAGYDFEQILAITRVVLATVLQVGGFSFP